MNLYNHKEAKDRILNIIRTKFDLDNTFRVENDVNIVKLLEIGSLDLVKLILLIEDEFNCDLSELFISGQDITINNILIYVKLNYEK